MTEAERAALLAAAQKLAELIANVGVSPAPPAAGKPVTDRDGKPVQGVEARGA